MIKLRRVATDVFGQSSYQDAPVILPKVLTIAGKKYNKCTALMHIQSTTVKGERSVNSGHYVTVADIDGLNCVFDDDLVFFPHQMGEKADSLQPQLEKGVAMILYTIDHTAELTTPSNRISPTATNATEGPVASISQREVATSQPSTAPITSAAVASKSF